MLLGLLFFVPVFIINYLNYYSNKNSNYLDILLTIQYNCHFIIYALQCNMRLIYITFF